MPKKDKLKEYRGKVPDEDQISLAEEGKLASELEPDPETVVATGDEEQPIGGSDHESSLKALYKKGRKNRELVTREDAEASQDIAMIQRMQAESSGGEVPETQIDTNRSKDHGTSDEEKEAARLIAREQEEEAGEEIREEKIAKPETDSLKEPADTSTIEVTILGRKYEIPQQDIDDAGGVEAYQKARAATIRLQRAATAERTALQAMYEANATRHEPQQTEDPSTDGQEGEADNIDAEYDALMDKVVEGTPEEIKEWIRNNRQPAPSPSTEPPVTSHEIARETGINFQTDTQVELEQQYEEDRVEANRLMREEYADIMADPELMALAKQRFAAIVTLPQNEGRTQKDMARESAEYVRGIHWRQSGRMKQPESEVEQERKTRIVRKRSIPQPSRADQPAPRTRDNEEKRVPTRKEHFLRLRQAAGHDIPPRQQR